MEKGTRNMMIAGGVGLLLGIAVGVGVSSAAKKSKKKCSCEEEEERSELDSEQIQEVDLEPEIKENQKTPSPVLTKENDDFPLTLGSVGKRVERLQVFLMRHFGGAGTISKVYDEETHERVLKYLKRKNIDQVTYDRLQMDKMVHDQRVKKQS